MLPEPAAGVVSRFLRRLDRQAGGLIEGFYIVGSIALGGFRAGRSDIDFVATLSGPLCPATLAELRSVHRRSYADGIARAAVSRSWPLVCNGVFIASEDLAHPPATVKAAAKQLSEKFVTGDSFDVNPVTWWTLAHSGIAVRGPSPEHFSIHLDDAELRRWTATNLTTYWRPWAVAVGGAGINGWRQQVRLLRVGRLAAWGVLGTARMHATIATGEVITKEQAGDYALDTFDPEWRPIINDALTYWRNLPQSSSRPPQTLRAETAAFVLHVIDLVRTDESRP
jgi:hypothetical protein